MKKSADGDYIYRGEPECKAEERIEEEKRGKDSFWKLTEAEYQTCC